MCGGRPPGATRAALAAARSGRRVDPMIPSTLVTGALLLLVTALAVLIERMIDHALEGGIGR